MAEVSVKNQNASPYVEEVVNELAVSVWSGDGKAWYEPVAFFGPRALGVSR
jgi:hypothetical protein